MSVAKYVLEYAPGDTVTNVFRDGTSPHKRQSLSTTHLLPPGPSHGSDILQMLYMESGDNFS